MVSTTTILSLTTFVGSDTVDLVTHVSTGLAQKVEDIFTGAAYPAGNLSIDFNSASNRTLTVKNAGAGTCALIIDGNLTPLTADGGALGTTALPLSDLFLASGAVIDFNAADVVLTHSADTLTLTGGGLRVNGNSAFGAAPATTDALLVSLAVAVAAGSDAHLLTLNGTTAVTGAGTTAVVSPIITSTALTVGAGATVTRLASMYANWTAPTVTGTLTNANTLFCETPSGAGTNRVVDSTAGGYLTTGGVWTDNPSFASLKRDITPVAATEQAALLDWLATEYKPVRYRYADAWTDERDSKTGKMVRMLGRYERDDVDYPHVGFLLDDMPQNIREIVCADKSGGIAAKDGVGFLLMLLQENTRQLKALQAKVN